MYSDFGIAQTPMAGSVQWLSALGSKQNVDTLIIPFAFAALSAALLVFHGLGIAIAARFRAKTEAEDSRGPPTHVNHVASLGGRVIFFFMVLRFLSTAAVFVLSAVILGLDSDAATSLDLARLSVTVTLLYSSILALSALVIRASWSRIVTRHYNATMLATFCVYLYRDVFPLTTFTLPIQDPGEGKLLWAKVALLGFLSFVLPLGIPRAYIPVDPENPSPEPAPEQTASIFSLATYSYLDSLVIRGYRLPQLPLDVLPPLADFDHSRYMRKQMFPVCPTNS